MSSLIAFNKPFNVVTQFSVHEKYQILKDSYYTNSSLLRVRLLLVHQLVIKGFSLIEMKKF
ncbi:MULTISPECIES: hypothetical protein [unclassified Gilliamella]|jgi:hypothetical protein|uniref:hypothetical protein n=1 Tax=unclassified Gilliamella TaxID=2685620 RepID=UPI001146D0EE|nr:hypothetical protein [Gilliamella apicola]